MRHVAYKTWAQGRLALQRGDVETTNTTARPQQGTAETGITSAPENCTKNTHFAPTKAMTVSIPHEHERAKAMAVSDNRPTWLAGSSCATSRYQCARYPKNSHAIPPRTLHALKYNR